MEIAKKVFEEPGFEVETFKAADILTTSNGNGWGGGEEGL